MFTLQNACRRTITRSVCAVAHKASARKASRISIPITPSFPVIDTCPAETCPCQDMPSGLDIDHEANINGTTAAYAEQILVSTGKPDWMSRIEDEHDAVLLRHLKQYLGRGGKFSDPFHNVLITNSSIPPSPVPSQPSRAEQGKVSPLEPQFSDTMETPQPMPSSVFLLPSFTYIPSLPTNAEAVAAFLQAFVLPTTLNSFHSSLDPDQKESLIRQPALASLFPAARPIEDILILVCGHGGRDKRCGVLGPILNREFETQLRRQGVRVLNGPPPVNGSDGPGHSTLDDAGGAVPAVRVASISHVGGHKFAGNVIVYVPPSFGGSALRGKGIWYGRVEPRHVQGIVAETVLGGKVIRELFRGGAGQGGEILRL